MLNETQIRYAQLHRYFADVCERARRARPSAHLDVTFKDGSKPERNRCHDNVGRWLHENPGESAVRGWLATCDAFGGCTFDLHSILETAAGDVVDITPFAYTLPFVPHLETEHAFEGFREAHLNQVHWPQPPPEQLSPARN